MLKTRQVYFSRNTWTLAGSMIKTWEETGSESGKPPLWKGWSNGKSTDNTRWAIYDLKSKDFKKPLCGKFDPGVSSAHQLPFLVRVRRTLCTRNTNADIHCHDQSFPRGKILYWWRLILTVIKRVYNQIMIRQDVFVADYQSYTASNNVWMHQRCLWRAKI